MDDKRAVEEAVRAYFESRHGPRPGDAAGPIGLLVELTEGVAEPADRLFERELQIDRLEVLRIENDLAEVAFDGVERVVQESPTGGRGTEKLFFGGPVTVLRVDGEWKVADYVLNGRRRSESIQLHVAGTQESDGLRLSAIAADVQTNVVLLYFRIENARSERAEIDWGALGSPRRRASWRYRPLGIEPSVMPANATTIAAGWTWTSLPLERSQLRVILVEKGRSVGFDFVLQLDSASSEAAAQRLPDALPWRLRLGRSPLALAPLLLLAALVFWLGSWEALGLSLVVCGALLLLLVAWHRVRRRPVPLRRPAVVGLALTAVGLITFWSAGSLFGGCPDRSEARQPADRFAFALLTEGREAAAKTMWSGTGPVQDELPSFSLVSKRRARQILRSGRSASGQACQPIPFPQLPGFPDPNEGDCVIYGVPSDVDPSSFTGSLVVFVGCEEHDWQVVGFG